MLLRRQNRSLDYAALRAAPLGMTGKWPHAIGLVREVVPAGQQLERAVEIARRIAGNAPLGLRAMKEAAPKYIQAGEAMAVAAIRRSTPR